MIRPPYGPVAARPHPKLEPLSEGIRRMDAVQEASEFARLVKQPQTSLNRRSAFPTEVLDLSSAALDDSAGQNIDRSGYGILYRRQGSAPGGRLLINLGGKIEDVRPGDLIQGFFESFQVQRFGDSAEIGRAALMIFTQPDAIYTEAEVAVGQQDPVYLLGSASTFVAVAENTQPAGAAPAGSFSPTGFRLLRVMIDGQAANTATSYDLIPWLRDPDSGLWYEQGTERISVPDSEATGYRYRTVSVPVAGNGLMYFEIRNLLPAAATQLSYRVQGLQ